MQVNKADGRKNKLGEVPEMGERKSVHRTGKWKPHLVSGVDGEVGLCIFFFASLLVVGHLIHCSKPTPISFFFFSTLPHFLSFLPLSLISSTLFFFD